jgi:S-adenosylmethionine:tRNA ribosyltransferase-isomerase
MQLSDFDYHLPDDLIAQQPLEDRASSRMLVLNRSTQSWEDRNFRDLPQYLRAGDCLVLNDTSVFASRLFGQKPGYDRQVEIFLLRPVTEDRLKWTALARPGRHLHAGTVVHFTPRLSCTILESGVRGQRIVQFECSGDFDKEVASIGHVPLPPYIHRMDEPADRERYQTVYAAKLGSVAAPTAGLHFTGEVLEACAKSGAAIAKVTLHVGLGTFQPLLEETVEQNKLHTEAYEIGEDAAKSLSSAKRVIAVGTTSVRTLETAARAEGFVPQSGETDIFIYPGFEFKAANALLTNFHLPKSSLVLLTSAFAGRDFLRAAYEHAVKERYRFFSYGDCMLIL